MYCKVALGTLGMNPLYTVLVLLLFPPALRCTTSNRLSEIKLSLLAKVLIFGSGFASRFDVKPIWYCSLHQLNLIPFVSFQLLGFLLFHHRHLQVSGSDSSPLTRMGDDAYIAIWYLIAKRVLLNFVD